MNETIDLILENSFLYVYGATIFVALYSYAYYFETPLKYLPILLTYTFLSEFLGYLIKQNPDFNPVVSGFYSSYNFVIYNIYSTIFMLYFYYIYWSLVKNIRYKKIIFILSYSYVIVAIANIFIQDYYLQYQLYAAIYGSIVLSFCIILYLLKQPKILRNKFAKESLLFWISLGLLVFTLGIIPIITYYTYSNLENMTLYYTIRRLHLILVNVMYGFFIYGFILMRSKLKTKQ
ncbi:MAG: hypothetical protein NWQ38_00895 [Cellulophaga sp.]|nr:hypothetical protein [Cellulophaga sp.]